MTARAQKWLHVAILVASPLFAAGGAWSAVTVKLEWLRADVDRAHARIDRIEERGNRGTFAPTQAARSR